ncbi:hypothetical protein [Jiangella sp. DSM 45060]|uniref:hypothetical protein n=1 Tax=Jiangella sp. DSM 45060 TaxID=1798224 RepID=UPI00087BA57D|nr:hypothetical protein [Jiangella sp. DSM 45060]SDT65350.1 hypothetical protein SAMN04515669_5489 [Jiangella sp. DSM 45060]
MTVSPLTRRSLLGAAGAGAVGVAAAGPVAAADPSGAEAETVSSRAAAEQRIVNGRVRALRTCGYAEAGDGGGALYRRLDAAPAEPDRWHLCTRDGAWWELAEDVVSVRALGAVGDYDVATGAGTDDTLALQAAARRGGTVYVPGVDGAYLTTDSISLLADGTHWFGDGLRSRITLVSGAGGAGELLGIHGAAPSTPSGPPQRYVQGVRVSGLHLDTSNGSNDNGLGGSFCRDVQVDNLYFSRIGRKALTFQYHCSNIRCRDVTVFEAATEPRSTFAVISIEGQTAGVDLSYYPGGTTSTEDLGGADVHDIAFSDITCLSTGYNYVVVSNAHRIRFDGLALGDTAGAGSFVIFTRKVWDSHVRGVRGGDTARRFLEIGELADSCTFSDLRFGSTTGTGVDGRAVRIGGTRIRLADVAFRHGNAGALEAVLVAGADATITGLHVAECASQYVLNAPPAGVRLKLTDSTFVSAAGAAFRIKGSRAHVAGNHFRTPAGPFAGRFEGPGNVFTGNHVAGAAPGRLVVTAEASAVATLNTFESGATITFDGGSLYASAAFGNTGLAAGGANLVPLAGGALHADGAGVLRIKDSRFTSDTDGAVVGAQT